MFVERFSEHRSRTAGLCEVWKAHSIVLCLTQWLTSLCVCVTLVWGKIIWPSKENNVLLLWLEAGGNTDQMLALRKTCNHAYQMYSFIYEVHRAPTAASTGDIGWLHYKELCMVSPQFCSLCLQGRNIEKRKTLWRLSTQHKQLHSSLQRFMHNNGEVAL